MRFKKYTKEDFVSAVASCQSIRQVLLTLGVAPHGGNYRVARGYIKKLGLDTTHFLGMAHNRGKVNGPKRPITYYFDNASGISSHGFRKRLLKEGYFEHRCYKCNLTKWNGLPIPLELEHIDGKHSNNKLENLTLLCPNCHAQTPTYRGLNRGKAG